MKTQLRLATPAASPIVLPLREEAEGDLYFVQRTSLKPQQDGEQLEVWSMAQGRVLWSAPKADAYVRASRQGNVLAAIDKRRGDLSLLDPTSGTKWLTVPGRGAGVLTLALNPDGSRLALLTEDRRLVELALAR